MFPRRSFSVTRVSSSPACVVVSFYICMLERFSLTVEKYGGFAFFAPRDWL